MKDGSGQGVLQDAAGTCPNYILARTRALTRPPATRSVYLAQWEMDYTGLQKLAGDLGVVVVTIRNRWFNAGVTLSTLIEDVTAAAKGIKVFHCMFCRVKEGSDTWAYTAVAGEEGWNSAERAAGAVARERGGRFRRRTSLNRLLRPAACCGTPFAMPPRKASTAPRPPSGKARLAQGGPKPPKAIKSPRRRRAASRR